MQFGRFWVAVGFARIRFATPFSTNWFARQHAKIVDDFCHHSHGEQVATRAGCKSPDVDPILPPRQIQPKKPPCIPDPPDKDFLQLLLLLPFYRPALGAVLQRCFAFALRIFRFFYWYQLAWVPPDLAAHLDRFTGADHMSSAAVVSRPPACLPASIGTATAVFPFLLYSGQRLGLRRRVLAAAQDKTLAHIDEWGTRRSAVRDLDHLVSRGRGIFYTAYTVVAVPRARVRGRRLRIFSPCRTRSWSIPSCFVHHAPDSGAWRPSKAT